MLTNNPAPIADPSTAVAPETPASTPVAAATLPANEGNSTPLEPAGTAESPFIVPIGTQEKFKELEAGGWKQEDVDAYLNSIEDEALRSRIKDGIDGKVHLAEDDAAPPVTNEPFMPEDLEKLDPAVAARIAFVQEQLLAQMDAVEKAREELPDPMKRLLQDPVVKARLDAVQRGDNFVPQMLNEEAIMGMAKSFVDSGDVAGLQDLLKTVVEAIPEVILEQRAELLRQQEQREIAAAENARTMNYLATGLQRLETRPEFQSNKPAVIETSEGPALNPEHPGAAFALWLEEAMKNDGLTLPLIERMGGIESVAYTWLAKQKGGFGQIVKGAVDKSNESLRDKLMRGRNGALAKSQAASLSFSSPGVAKTLLHGVDVDKALSDPFGYAKSATKGLTDSQRAEVAKEMRKRAGIG